MSPAQNLLNQQRKNQNPMIKLFKNSDPIKIILAAIVFLFSLVIYMMTMAPTVSFWDCGEFIATSYILGVPHPPGSPFFLLLGRFFAMLPLGHDIAWRVTLISPIVTAFANMFLFLIIVHFMRMTRGKIESVSDKIIAYGGGLIGALIFAFTDSHWFNAVEAEVYAMSTFFTAIVVWLILVWEERSDKSGHERYLLIIMYLIGIATGVHLLNLLALPFVGMIIYFKKYKFEPKTFAVMMGVVLAVFIVIYKGIIKGFPRFADTFGLGFVVFSIIAIIAISIYLMRSEYRMLRFFTMALALTIIGFSSYAMVFIRATQDPAIDENDPETTEAFISYMEREQYGSTAVFPRQFKGLPPSHKVLGEPRKYGKNGQPVYPLGKRIKYALHDPGAQLSYFWNYQFKKMYVRYFLWQFAGRGQTEIGDFANMGANEVNGKIKKSHTEDGVDFLGFLSIPLLLGIFGMYYHYKKDKHSFYSVLALFLMTGLAIIVYLNQPDPQPRERDYSYVGSFFAFAIFIGLGVSGLIELVKVKLNRRFVTAGLTIIFLAVPVSMLAKNYHSHNRTGDYMPWDYSYNLLQSCEPDAVLFTNGDNDTFPLWYLQEVEGIRKDVRVVNLSLLNTPWYIKQLKNRDPKIAIGYPDKTIDGGLFPKSIKSQKAEVEYLLSGANPKVKKDKRGRLVVGLKINAPENPKGRIEFNLRPTFQRIGLRVQDFMVIHILAWNEWKRPIYFAVTVPGSNRANLDPYLRMDGVAFKVTQTKKQGDISTEILANHIMEPLAEGEFFREYNPRYRFRELNNPDIHFNETTTRLVGNYRSSFMQLAADYVQKARTNPEHREEFHLEARNVLDRMEEIMPEDLLPLNPDFATNKAVLLGEIGDETALETMLEKIKDSNIKLGRRIRYAEMLLDYNPEMAESVFVAFFDEHPQNIDVFHGLVLSYYLQNKTQPAVDLIHQIAFDEFRPLSERLMWCEVILEVDSEAAVDLFEKLAQKYPDDVEIISYLIAAYEQVKQFDKAIALLDEWLAVNPTDSNAKKMKKGIQRKQRK